MLFLSGHMASSWDSLITLPCHRQVIVEGHTGMVWSESIKHGYHGKTHWPGVAPGVGVLAPGVPFARVFFFFFLRATTAGLAP